MNVGGMKMYPECSPFIKENLQIEHTQAQDGLLQGLTFSLKDVFAVAGHTNAAGNPDWLNTHAPASEHAAVVTQLLQHGANLKGMTHTDELMFSLNGENVHYGTPRNPNAPGHIPGGSSSGSASSVAAHLVDFSIGTDTGGSVRVPSAYCGIYGMRPTHGRISMDGVIPLAPSFDTVGWMARNTETLLRIGRALMEDDREGGSSGFEHFYFEMEAWRNTDESCVTLLEEYLSSRSVINRREWIEVAPEGLGSWFRTFRTIQGYEIWRTHGAWISQIQPKFGPGIAERFAWAATVKQEDFEKEVALRKLIRSRMNEILNQSGLLVLPTVPCPAPKIGLTGDKLEQIRSRVMRFSCIAGLSGYPQVTIPVPGPGGLPIGLSFIAGAGQDLKLLQWVTDVFST